MPRSKNIAPTSAPIEASYKKANRTHDSYMSRSAKCVICEGYRGYWIQWYDIVFAFPCNKTPVKMAPAFGNRNSKVLSSNTRIILTDLKSITNTYLPLFFATNSSAINIPPYKKPQLRNIELCGNLISFFCVFFVFSLSNLNYSNQQHGTGYVLICNTYCTTTYHCIKHLIIECKGSLHRSFSIINY